MKNITIKNKLYLLICIMIVSLGSMGIFSLIFINEIRNSSTVLEKNYYPSIIITSDLSNLIDNYRECESKHIEASNADSKYFYEMKLKALSTDINQLLNKYEELILEEENITLYSEFKNNWEEYLELNSSLLTLSNAYNTIEAFTIYNTYSDFTYEKLEHSIKNMINYHKRDVQTAINKNQEQYTTFIQFTIVILFLIILIAFFSIHYITKSIKKPIDDLLFVTKQISVGNLNVDIDYSSNDEISELLFSSKTLIEKLNKIVKDEKQILEEFTKGNYLISSCCIDEYTGDFYPIIDSLNTLSKHLKNSIDNEYQAILLQELSQNVDVVFFIYDLSTQHLEYVFENSERILGILPESLIEDFFILFKLCKSEIYEQMKEIFSEKKLDNRFHQEVDFVNPRTNQYMYLSIVIIPVSINNIVTKYIMAVEDLTEYKMNHKVLEDALLNAQNANAAKSMFFSSISHDIRTPLNAIIGMTSIALSNIDNDDNSKLKDCLNKITFSSNHLLMLINDVLDTAKIESGKLTLNNETFDLRKIIEEIIAITSSQAKAKRQKIKVLFKNVNYPLLIGDALRLTQILLNIVSNAINYTPANGKILIKVKQFIKHTNDSIKVQFSISDNGHGISAEFIEKIFLPFEREQHTKASNQVGTGLGMAIAKNLTTLMNGSIRVNSILNKGSTFIVTLPFVVAYAEKKVFHDKYFEELDILVIDSEESALAHIQHILDHCHVNAVYKRLAKDGLRTLKIAALDNKQPFDIVIVDLHLVDISAITAIQALRSITSETFIIATYSQHDSSINEALTAGADVCLIKPFTQLDLYNILLTAKDNSPKNPNNIHINPDILKGYRILIVEDNELNMEIAIELLKQTGANLECAYDGKKAFSLYESSPEGYYNLILMDVQMPQVDGYTATKLIRSSTHKDAQTIPIIAMTSYSYIEDINYALNTGMNAHIAKPIDVNVLYKIIQKELHLTKKC